MNPCGPLSLFHCLIDGPKRSWAAPVGNWPHQILHPVLPQLPATDAVSAFPPERLNCVSRILWSSRLNFPEGRTLIAFPFHPPPSLLALPAGGGACFFFDTLPEA
jgi:hypothetical protein